MWREELGDMDDPTDRPEFGFMDRVVQDKIREDHERAEDARIAEIADIMENF